MEVTQGGGAGAGDPQDKERLYQVRVEKIGGPSSTPTNFGHPSDMSLIFFATASGGPITGRDSGNSAAGVVEAAGSLPRLGPDPLAFLRHHGHASAGDFQHIPAVIPAAAYSQCFK